MLKKKLRVPNDVYEGVIVINIGQHVIKHIYQESHRSGQKQRGEL